MGAVSPYGTTCAKCLDPIEPGAPFVQETQPTGEVRTVHPECATPKPKRMCGKERGG